ncbi:MAG TPA: hypothetical protein DC049_20555 [Spirochaetia bacterium]|nr:hypothetical protein [Spirochaetia bacterium]
MKDQILKWNAGILRVAISILFLTLLIHAAGENLIKNGDFSAALNNVPAEWALNPYGEECEYTLIKGQGPENKNFVRWGAKKLAPGAANGSMLFQTGTAALKAGTAYKMVFQARSSSNMSIIAKIQKTAPYQDTAKKKIDLTQNWEQYELIISASEDMTAYRICFFPTVSGIAELACIEMREDQNLAKPAAKIEPREHTSANGVKWKLWQLTDDDSDDWAPSVDENGNCVWFAGTEHRYWDGSAMRTIPQIQNKLSWHCLGAYISKGKIALREYLGDEKFGIFIFDIKTGKKERILADFPYQPGPRGHKGGGRPLGPDSNDWYSYWISIDGEEIAFCSFDGNDYEIYYWNGKKLQQITDNDFDDYFPVLSKGQISYAQRRGIFKINLWDGKKNIRLTGWSTNAGRLDDDNVQVDHFLDNGRVAFATMYLPNDNFKGYNIALWENGEFKYISKFSFVNLRPVMSGNLIGWSGWGKNNTATSKWQVYIWDGQNIDNLSNNDEVNGFGGVNNGWVAWYGQTARSKEIFLARRAKE